MIVRDRAPAHQSRHDRHVDRLRELHQQIGRIRVDDAAACDNQRPFGCIEHLQRFLDLLARGRWLVDRKRLVGLVIEFDLCKLHIERQIDQHRTGAAGAHDVKRLTEHARHQRRLAYGDGPFGHRLGDGFDIDGLEVFLVQTRAWRLSSDAQDRNRIRDGGVQPCDHVGARRAGGADTNADISCLGARIAFSHVRGALDVTRENMIDRTSLFQRGIKRIDCRARNAERADDAFLFENAHRCIDCPHLRHGILRSKGSERSSARQQAFSTRLNLFSIRRKRRQKTHENRRLDRWKSESG